MKSEGKVRQKYKQAKFRARSSFVEKRMKARPCNCLFRGEVAISEDLDRVVACRFLEVEEDSDWDVDICTPKQARQCPKFTPQTVSEELKDSFESLVEYSEESGDLGPLASEYPDLAALLWVLEEFEPSQKNDTEQEPVVPEEALQDEPQFPEVETFREAASLLPTWLDRATPTVLALCLPFLLLVSLALLWIWG